MQAIVVSHLSGYTGTRVQGGTILFRQVCS